MPAPDNYHLLRQSFPGREVPDQPEPAQPEPDTGMREAAEHYTVQDDGEQGPGTEEAEVRPPEPARAEAAQVVEDRREAAQQEPAGGGEREQPDRFKADHAAPGYPDEVGESRESERAAQVEHVGEGAIRGAEAEPADVVSDDGVRVGVVWEDPALARSDEAVRAAAASDDSAEYRADAEPAAEAAGIAEGQGDPEPAGEHLAAIEPERAVQADHVGEGAVRAAQDQRAPALGEQAVAEGGTERGEGAVDEETGSEALEPAAGSHGGHGTEVADQAAEPDAPAAPADLFGAFGVRVEDVLDLEASSGRAAVPASPAEAADPSLEAADPAGGRAGTLPGRLPGQTLDTAPHEGGRGPVAEQPAEPANANGQQTFWTPAPGSQRYVEWSAPTTVPPQGFGNARGGAVVPRPDRNPERSSPAQIARDLLRVSGIYGGVVLQNIGGIWRVYISPSLSRAGQRLEDRWERRMQNRYRDPRPEAFQIANQVGQRRLEGAMRHQDRDQRRSQRVWGRPETPPALGNGPGGSGELTRHQMRVLRRYHGQ